MTNVQNGGIYVRFLDYDGLGYLIEELKDKFVQQQAGKGLSANDFTNILKEKLDSIESGAEKNVVHSVNGREGDIVITSDDVEFLSSVSGATPTTIRAIIDDIIAKDKAQDIEIAKKADKSTTYTKTQVDDVIKPKADKSYVDGELGKKANQTTTYTKDEVDSKLGDIDSGVISVNEKTGVVTLDTDDISDASATNKFVTTGEKASWNAKANVSYVDTEVAKKVDKISGKGLSTNDFTTALKNKLDAIEAGAQKNVIELIKRNGTNLPVDGKAINIEVPTKLGELTNDVTFQTKAQVQSLIADQGKMKKEIVASLPSVSTADDNTMYLVRNKQDSGYEEWMVINGTWEILGDTAAVDFTGYVHEDDITLITNAEIDAFLNV